jgi:hypothetical protein
MTEEALSVLLELEKRCYHKLVEATDLTRDLSEAVDRNDQVSLGLFLSLRQKALLEMQEIRSLMQLKRLELDPSEVEAFDRLLAGETAESPLEQPLVEQIAANRRLLGQLEAMDRRVNEKLCGEHSFYQR